MRRLWMLRGLMKMLRPLLRFENLFSPFMRNQILLFSSRSLTPDIWHAVLPGHEVFRNILGQAVVNREQSDKPIVWLEWCLSTDLILAFDALPRETFLTMLEALVRELDGRRAYEKKRPRLMIQAGCLEEPAHLALIESLGGAIVDDSLCFGRRYFDTLVDESAEDPLAALADRYLNHLSCPRMGDDFQSRLAYTRRAAGEYRLDGLICERLKFCDLWGGEAFILRREAKKIGLPTLYLERELYAGGEGQLKTRVQAFMERIGSV